MHLVYGSSNDIGKDQSVYAHHIGRSLLDDPCKTYPYDGCEHPPKCPEHAHNDCSAEKCTGGKCADGSCARGGNCRTGTSPGLPPNLAPHPAPSPFQIPSFRPRQVSWPGLYRQLYGTPVPTTPLPTTPFPTTPLPTTPLPTTPLPTTPLPTSPTTP